MQQQSQAKSRFESVGVYLPETLVSTAELMGKMASEPFFDLQELTGIETRRVRDRSEDSFTLALKACQSCLSKSKFEPEDLEALIYVSITRFKGELTFQFDPAMSLLLKRELGAHNAINFDLSNACAGMCTGTHVLDHMIRAGVVKNGLIVSGECITPIAESALKELSAEHNEQLASLTVGDSGSACIMERCSSNEAGIDFTSFLTVGEFSQLCIGMPSDKRAGVAMYTKSAKLQVETIKRFPLLLEKVLQAHGKSLKDYDVLIPHQTSVNAIRMGSQALSKFFQQELPEVISIVSKYGNTSSTSHFVALDAAIKNREVRQGDRVLLLVMASGIVLGFVSFTVGFLEASHVQPNLHGQRLQRTWVG